MRSFLKLHQINTVKMLSTISFYFLFNSQNVSKLKKKVLSETLNVTAGSLDSFFNSKEMYPVFSYQSRSKGGRRKVWTPSPSLSESTKILHNPKIATPIDAAPQNIHN